MEDYKSHKILPIVSQFEKVGDRYEINGIEVSKAIFFYRRQGEKFQLIPLGSYTVINEAGNIYLVIQDDEILASASDFQICYSFAKSSSRYEEEFPDIQILKDKYNSLYDDFTNVLTYIVANLMSADNSEMSLILPELLPNCVWYMTDAGTIENLQIDGMVDKQDAYIMKMYNLILDLLNKDVEVMKKVLQTEGDNQFKKVSDEGVKQLSAITTEGTKQVKAVTDEGEKKKQELATSYYAQLPIGTVISIGHNEVPLGFLLCDGRTISQSEYPELYRLYGSNIPDYRDMFLRGNVAGREIGSLQGEAIRNITASLHVGNGSGSTAVGVIRAGYGAMYADEKRSKCYSVDSAGTFDTYYVAHFDASRVVPTGSENRPINTSVNFIIKAQNVVNPSSAVDVAEELNRKMEVLNGQIGELEETSVKALKGENILLFRNGEYLTYKKPDGTDTILAMLNQTLGNGSASFDLGAHGALQIRTGSFACVHGQVVGAVYFERAFANGCFAVAIESCAGDDNVAGGNIILNEAPQSHGFFYRANPAYNIPARYIAIGH